MSIAKVLMFQGTGEIDPDAAGFTPTVIDDPLGSPKTMVVEGLGADEFLTLVCENYVGDGWESVPDGEHTIQFSRKNKSVLLSQHGVYGVTTGESGSGGVAGTVTIYTREWAA